jgi:hypothetical protein
MSEWSAIGRWLLIFGLILAAVGGALWLAGRLGLPLGRLPGDLRWKMGNVSCFFPLATSLLLSLILTLALAIITRLLNR